MNRLKINPSWVVTLCLIFWGLSLIVLVSPSIIGTYNFISALLPLVILIAVLLTFVSAIMLVLGLYSRDPKNENYARNPVAKSLALLIIAAILISTYAAIKSFWYSPLSDSFGDRFVYENIATGVGFAGIVLTIILSALQKDIYWVSRKKTDKLDERQLKERREVFETSYELGVSIIFLAVWQFGRTLHNIPAIIGNHHGTIPGHMFWIGSNLVLTMFALPLIVGALKKK